MSENNFRGIFTPIVTPLSAEEEIDLVSLHRLVDWQIGRGVHGIWAMGTSGEFASFTPVERHQAAETVLEAAAGRVPVVVNVSDASTRLAVLHAKAAVQAGASAIALTPPYYYPHSQDELLTHYRVVREAAGIPLFIYNIPQTVRVKVELKTARLLALEGTVAGIKDSQNDLEWFRQLVLFVRRENIPFAAFAGTRHLIDAAVLAGADGAIPSVANAFPEVCVEVYEAARRGDFELASRRQTFIVDVETASTSLSRGSRNAQVLGVLKAILKERGLLQDRNLTQPLVTMTDDEWLSVRSYIDCLSEAV
jgi:4-hydroxy-tetrahydrodipicolinate synthase